MKTFKISLITFFLLSFIFFSYNILISDRCKKSDIVILFKTFGINFLSECYFEKEVKDNIKNLLKNNKFIYNLVANLKIKLLPEYGKSRDIYKDFDFNAKYERKNFEVVTDYKGIINSEILLDKYKVDKSYLNKDIKTWSRSYANNYNTKFYDSKKINLSNIDNLKLKWKFDPIEQSDFKKEWKSRIGINPIYSDGIIYFVSANWELNAVKADTGKLIWSKKFISETGRRGILIDNSFLYVNSGKNLFKINAKNGKLDPNFGNGGFADVGKSQVAPVIYKKIIIVPNIKGQIIGVDSDTGGIIFKNNIHQDYDFNFYSVPWGGAALDEHNKIYYIVTGNPKPYHIGIFRPGENKNANSIIAFDIDKKKIIWTFQDIRHDLWNLDISAPPILADINIKNRIIETIIVTTKTGNILFFERKSGKPIYDINYVDVPDSNLPGELTAKKQILIKKPERFAKIEFSLDDLRQDLLNDSYFLNKFKKESIYGYFQPPTLGKDTILYGIIGGNNWYGSAYNPITKKLLIPSNHVPFLIKVFPISKKIEKNKILKLQGYDIYLKKCSSCHGLNRNGVHKIDTYEKELKNIPSLVGFHIFEPLKKNSLEISKFKEKHKEKFEITNEELSELDNLFKKWDLKLKKENKIGFEAYYTLLTSDDGVPISKPPWGTISSVDLLTGKIDWKIPFGYYKNKNLGVQNVGGLSVTSANLIFGTGTYDNHAFAFDGKTGREIWKYKMSAAGTTPPLIFEYKDQQYVSFLSTGGIEKNSSKSSSLYTFSLSEN